MLKNLKALKNIAGQRFLVRCDFDVPLKILNGKSKKPTPQYLVADDARLSSCLPTIQYLLKKGVKIILIGHLGRPQGQIVPALSLQPVKNHLEKLLAHKITLIPIERYLGPAAKIAAKQLSAGDIIMLENLRFSDREELNCRRFAKELSLLAKYYINEAFAVSHRPAASVSAIRQYLPGYFGFHLQAEVERLSLALKKPRHPLTLVIGGAKIETKLPVIKQFLGQAEHILVGGAIANDFFKALGYEVGRSLLDGEYIKEAEQILAKTQEPNAQLVLPLDVVVAGRKKAIKEPYNVLPTETILDIGPQTIKLYQKIISQSKMVIWNGPLGKFEDPQFALGTKSVAQAILRSSASSLVGGGETGEVIKAKAKSQKPKLRNNIFVSVGGGAMLAFLSGKKLPGLT